MERWENLSVGHRVRLACDIQGMTLEEAARRAKISVGGLYHISSGRAIGKVSTLVKLSVALGVRIGWLLEGEGDIWRPRPETQKTGEQASSPIPPRHRAPSYPATPSSPRRRKK